MKIHGLKSLIIGTMALGLMPADQAQAQSDTRDKAVETKVQLKSINGLNPDSQDEERIYLGVVLGSINDALRSHLKLRKNTGLLVERTLEGSPATQAGVKQYDILTHLDAQILINRDQLVSVLSTYDKGEKATLKLIREGQAKELTVELDKMTFPKSQETPLNFELDVDLLKDHLQGNKIQLKELQDALQIQQKFLNENWKVRERGIGKGSLDLKAIEDLDFRISIDPNIPFSDVLKVMERMELDKEGIPISISKAQNHSISIGNNERTIAIQTKDGIRHLVLKDPDGKVLYNGVVDDENQYLKEIPENHRKAVEDILNDSKFKLQGSGSKQILRQLNKVQGLDDNNRRQVSQSVSKSVLNDGAGISEKIVNRVNDLTMSLTIKDGKKNILIEGADGKKYYAGQADDSSKILGSIPEKYHEDVSRFLKKGVQ